MDFRGMVMAAAGRRADERVREAVLRRQKRLASVIHASIAEAGEAVSVDEAIAMLDSFFPATGADDREERKYSPKAQPS
jgi:hypothetical protein